MALAYLLYEQNFIIESMMHQNLLDKIMFPVHIPKLQRVILNTMYLYSANYEND